MTSFMPKIVLYGSGMIGGLIGLLTSLKKLSNNVLFVDLLSDLAVGKSLDAAEGLAIDGVSTYYESSDTSELKSNSLKDADVVIITAGIPRKPGMSRDDLLSVNAKIIKMIAERVKENCPKAFVVLLTNPLDVMTALFQKYSEIPVERVVGMGGCLDCGRFKHFLSKKLSVSPDLIHTNVLGGHGDQMVFLLDYTSVSGIPLQKFINNGMISSEEVNKVVERTKYGGAEILELFKNGSAFVAPALAAIAMVKSYLHNEKKIFCASVYIDNMYGLNSIFIGVPCVIGSSGVEKIIELELDAASQAQLKNSADNINDLKKASELVILTDQNQM